MSLKQVLELLELPSRGEVQAEGLNPDIETYRRVASKIANSYFATAQLALLSVGEDLYEVRPIGGHSWRDAAFSLGYLANLAAGRDEVQSSKGFLKYRAPEGGFKDYREAVLANLDLLRTLPESLKINSSRETMLKALELVAKGPADLLAAA